MRKFRRRVRRDREKKQAATLARKTREARLPKFSKLAFQAQRSGQRGADALAVLQDALLETYGPQFRAAIRQAKARRNSKRRGTFEPWLVVFAPTMERAYHKHPATASWYSKARWPFTLVKGSAAKGVHKLRPTAVVVWDSAPGVGFKAHHWVKRRLERRLEEKLEPRGRAELEVMSYVSTVGDVRATDFVYYERSTGDDSLTRGELRRTIASLLKKGLLVTAAAGFWGSSWRFSPRGRRWAINRGWSPAE